ncbi:hypothetical protein MVI27_11390 [Chryseobacterium salipaludis]|uniref:hypothetical protein n=1 Tax=Chryseobacterium TaxID=59732 RepID=UPI001FF29294|nr:MULTISPECIES: hypothetical protein [Chryseobacterium]MCJ8498853.1 hypothetical protein [Chryseobacterium salipaludis]MCX3297792.1 hypothetical protein [Planobacterium sp. JC490]
MHNFGEAFHITERGLAKFPLKACFPEGILPIRRCVEGFCDSERFDTAADVIRASMCKSWRGAETFAHLSNIRNNPTHRTFYCEFFESPCWPNKRVMRPVAYFVLFASFPVTLPYPDNTKCEQMEIPKNNLLRKENYLSGQVGIQTKQWQHLVSLYSLAGCAAAGSPATLSKLRMRPVPTVPSNPMRD